MNYLEVGSRFGDYVVEKLLGRGGMGAVYLLRAVANDALYAVKIMIPPEGAEAEREFRRRFAREAYFAMKIRHRNLIAVYDVGEDPDTGLCYIIMDYVPGGNLSSRLYERGRLGIREAVELTIQIASALNLAHEFGVVHRDIKPDNIMFDAEGTPKLSDLGIAKFADDSSTATSVTSTGIVMGTPAYMAPEQMMDSHQVDARADIYSLGMVLYEMLTGERPHGNSSMLELVAKAVKGVELPNVRTLRPEVPPEIAKIISSMCSNRPDKRPASALMVAQLCMLALEKWRRRTEHAAWLKRMRKRIVLGACGLLLGVAGLIGICVCCWPDAPQAVEAQQAETVQEALTDETKDETPAPEEAAAAKAEVAEKKSGPETKTEPKPAEDPHEPGTRELKCAKMNENLRALVKSANDIKGGSVSMWGNGRLVCGKLKLEGYSAGCRDVASWTRLDENTGEFAVAVHPGRGKVVFMKHGYEPLEVPVPEAKESWRDDLAVDVGTVTMRRIKSDKSAMVSFRVKLAGNAGKAQVELTLVNEEQPSSVKRWNGNLQTPRVGAYSRTVKDGQFVSIGNCVPVRHILTIKAEDGSTYRRELNFSKEKYCNLGDIKLGSAKK